MGKIRHRSVHICTPNNLGDFFLHNQGITPPGCRPIPNLNQLPQTACQRKLMGVLYSIYCTVRTVSSSFTLPYSRQTSTVEGLAHDQKLSVPAGSPLVRTPNENKSIRSSNGFRGRPLTVASPWIRTDPTSVKPVADPCHRRRT